MTSRGRSGATTGARVLVAHPGAELYGSDRMVLEAVAGLRAAGVVPVVVLPEHGPLTEQLAGLGVEVHTQPMPVLRKSALRPRGLLDLVAVAVRSAPAALALLRRTAPEAVYVSTLTIPSWLLLARLARVRLVCHVHEAEQHPSRLVSRALVAPLLLAHAVVANSAYSRQVLVDAWPRLAGRTRVVLNGVAGPDRADEARADVADGLRVLYVGRLSPRKGPDVAVEAVRLLDRSGVPCRLTLLGSTFPGYEWFRDELEEKARSLSRSGDDAAGALVRIADFTPSVWQSLADADVVVVPSTLPEPFGNTAVEAMLAARPVVVSDIGGLPEAVADSAGARRVHPGDPQALAAALAEVAADWDTVRTAASAARPGARSRFAVTRFRTEVAAAVLGSASSRSQH